ncbi:MAG TPA: FlgD immunoglobulin-like domain containing protein [Candidatus Krumholzibacteria bacterium]|nr:FlgD immunoglobulin-like domain containing protein [Candidatus Krumholzibacteria bacterium]
MSDRSPALPAFRPAAATTTLLHAATFDVAGECSAQGWVAVDLTVQTGDYFHVDDYTGLAFGPVAGAQSLWCGARASATGVLCTYQTLPGYGNTWNQAWCTKTCIAVGGDLDVSFQMRLDSEPSYDAVTLEYTTDCAGATGWTVLDGGIGVWDGSQNLVIGDSYSVPGATDVRVRLRFESDGAWSDEDGLFDSDGAVHIDALAVEGLAIEDFEDETAGVTSSNDWISCNPPGYGSFAGLVTGASVVQDADACIRDVTCLWAFFVGSTYDFACGGHPLQKVVPYKNANGQYLNNEVWSPPIELTGTGSQLNLEYWMYSDLTLNDLVFPVWHIRDIAGGCPGRWVDRNFIYWYQPKGWWRYQHPVGDLVDLGTASHVQVALGAVDFCSVWCGTVGTGECHSHTPLFDNVKVYRVDVNGPQWAIRDLDQFQDNFAEIAGPSAGRTRADMANDISPGSHVGSIIPGDSAVVRVADPMVGLGIDPVAGGAAVYGYVSVWPQGQADKTGGHLTQNTTRWPVAGSWIDAGGVSWTCLRLDSSIVSGVPQPDIYCLDLNDNLFEPGDTVCFFYAAKNATGVETYAFGSNLALTSDDRNEAASDAAEFTCLPTGFPWILYVDGMDGRGAQPYWDTAFATMGLASYIDRFDVRGPSSGVSNRLAGRVKNITQLVPAYDKILWDCGDLSTTLGDGSGSPEKTDDYGLINQFLANLTPSGGVYLGGDDVPSQLAAYAGPGALAFRATYLPFSLVAGDHRPAYGVSPVGTAVPGGSFIVDPTFVIHGGCPLLNDFDVMQPSGSATNEITYGPGGATTGNGALLGNQVGDVRVLLGGFSFIYIRDDEEDGILDRAAYLDETLTYLFGPSPFPTATGPARATRLEQNYPNPFNPQTTIAFSLAQRGAVTLAVYDVAGRLVRRLADGTADAGEHSAAWDGHNDAGAQVASGVYFYKLTAGDFVQTRKMVLLK